MHQRCLGHAFLSAVHFSLVRCLVHARMRCLVHAPAQLSRLRRTLGCASCKSLPGHAPCCQASGHARSCCKTFGHALGWCCKSQVGMRLGSARPHSLLRASGVWLSRYGGRCLSGTSGPPVRPLRGRVRWCCKTLCGHARCCKTPRGRAHGAFMRLGSARPQSLLRASGVWAEQVWWPVSFRLSGPPV